MPAQHLLRASMVLRGVRPSAAEIQQVVDDPSALAAVVEGYLYDPRFGDAMRDLHNEAWSFRATAQTNVPASGTLAVEPMGRLRRSLYESPLRTISYIIEEDRPYTEILTADYQLADDVVARAWSNLDGYDQAAGGWQVVGWSDDRPRAGILSDNVLYIRFASMGSNYNRGRANSMSRALLCHDYLDREITLEGALDLSNPDVVADAVTASEACATCHRTLDPLASFFPFRTGFALYLQEWPAELYDPNWVTQEGWWYATEVAPSYYGQAGTSLDDLARDILADDRFALCTAKRFYAWMTQTPLHHVPDDVAGDLQDVLVGSGWNARTLARAVVMHPDFRVSHARDAATADGLVGLQKVRPEQLERMVADLTGFTWQTDVPELCCGAPAGSSPVGVIPVTTDAWSGFQTLLGGIDGAFVSQPSNTANTTSTLALRQLAAEAAAYLVREDFALPAAERRRLRGVEATTVDEASIRAQLVSLHVDLYAEQVAADDASVSLAWSIWSEVHRSSGDGRRAWEATLTAMLQDWRMFYY
jgi:hypothetical protein